MNKIRREREVTCQRIGEDNVRIPFACKQVVEIEEEDNEVVYTSVHHNGEVLTMDLENLMSLYALIGGAIGEYYHKTSTQFTPIDIKQALGRVDRRDNVCEEIPLPTTFTRTLELNIISFLEKTPKWTDTNFNGKKIMTCDDFVGKLGNPVAILQPILDTMVERGDLGTSTFPNSEIGYHIS